MENTNLLKVSVKKRQENPVRGADYEIKVNDLVLGRGVSDVSLELPAGGRPKMTIECFPDEIIFDELQAKIKLKPLKQFDDSFVDKTTTCKKDKNVKNEITIPEKNVLWERVIPVVISIIVSTVTTILFRK